MRSKKALINTIAGIGYEFISIICGFIVPRLILGAFGSQYNGITSSVTQFLNCISLFRLSVSGVTRAALYKPLAENDIEKTSAIVKATENFLQKVALIFSGTVVVFAAVYPFMIKDDFDWLFSFTLVLILGISTFVQYYFGISYQILLQADQRQGILSLVQIFSVVLNTILAAVLIRFGASIHVVKLGSAVAFSLNPLILNTYARKKYKLNRKAKPDNQAISQRWDAFGHATATFIHSNTDIVILTIFSNLYEVSVYTVYSLVCNGLKVMFKTLTASVGAALGNMLAKKEMDTVQKNMDLFEYVGITLGSFLFTIAGIMMLPFVTVYTKGITDTNYIRPGFSFLIILSSAFFCFRIPYQTLVEAAGHFKQTRNGAFFEAFANIFISIVAVYRFGLIGVTMGTLFATVFRTLQYVWYLKNNIIFRSPLLFVKQISIAAAACAVSCYICNAIRIVNASDYFDFALHTMICGIITGIIFLLISLVFYRKQLQDLIALFLRALKKKKKSR